MKRWGKSPPLQAQARRHGKPHRVQGQIGDPGAARSIAPHSGTGSGYWLLRQMILSAALSERDRLRSFPERAAKTKFGLQPFQVHSGGRCFADMLTREGVHQEALKKMGLMRQSGFFRLMAVIREHEISIFLKCTTSGRKMPSVARTNRLSEGCSIRVR